LWHGLCITIKCLLNRILRRAQNKLRSTKYVRELLLPFAADEESIHMRFREGIFEITFRRKQKGKGK